MCFSFKIINIETRIWDYMQHGTKIDMVSQTILIGIIVGVFFAGLGIGYAVFQSSNQPNFAMMTPQQMTPMMNNPQMMNQWHQTMMNNPQAMNNWMNTMMQNPDMMNQWHQTMMNNPQAMNNWMNTMMQNPDMMNQWHQTMMNNTQFQNQWMNPMMGNWNGTMWSHMGSGMISGNMMMGNTTGMMHDNVMLQLMQDPEMRKEMIKLMKEHVSEMDELLSSNLTNQEFNMKMVELMQKHMQSMQNLMNNTQFQNQWMMNPNMMGGNMMGYGMMGTPVTKQSDVIKTINKIESILDQVSSSYRSGDKDSAFSQATSAYLENYEYIENAISAKDLNQMEKIELLLRVDLRNLIQTNQSADSVDAKIDSIKSELEKVKSLS